MQRLGTPSGWGSGKQGACIGEQHRGCSACLTSEQGLVDGETVVVKRPAECFAERQENA